MELKPSLSLAFIFVLLSITLDSVRSSDQIQGHRRSAIDWNEGRRDGVQTEANVGLIHPVIFDVTLSVGLKLLVCACAVSIGFRICTFFGFDSN